MKIASIVGLVTNSSTVIYSYAEANAMRRFLDILGITNVTVEVVYDFDNLRNYLYDVVYDHFLDVPEYANPKVSNYLHKYGIHPEIGYGSFMNKCSDEFISGLIELAPDIVYVDDDTPTVFKLYVDGKYNEELSELVHNLVTYKEGFK